MAKTSKARHAKMLRTCAERYFNDDPTLETRSGICRATGEYPAMSRLMRDLKEPCSYFGLIAQGREKWAPRAWMCLFLAEYLEGSLA